MSDQSVSIIIPVLNQIEKLERCLIALHDQLKHINNIEVLVVDNGSTDGSELLAERYNFYINPNQKGKESLSSQKRRASIAKGEVLVFLDAKCLPSGNYIAEIQKICLDKDWDLVAGDFDFIGLSSESSLSELAYAIVYLRSNPKYNNGEVATLTGNMMVRRDVFFDLGKFDIKRSGGDVRFSQKANRLSKLKIYNSNLRVYYNAKKHDDLIQSIKRVASGIPSKVSWRSIRPAGSQYINERLSDLNIKINGFKRFRLKFFIMYLRYLKYYHQIK